MPQGPATRRFAIFANCCSEQFLFAMMSCDAIKNSHSSNVVALCRRSLRHIVNKPFYVNPVCTHNMQIKSPYCLRTCVHTCNHCLRSHACTYIHTHKRFMHDIYSWPLPYSCKQCCMPPVYAGQLERSVVFVCECVGMWEVIGRNKEQSPISDDSS